MMRARALSALALAALAAAQSAGPWDASLYLHDEALAARCGRRISISAGEVKG